MAYQNRLLAALSDSDRALICQHLEPLSLPLGTVIASPNEPISHVTFVEKGLCSVVANSGESTRIEIGLFGRDGVLTPLLLGVDRTPHQVFMQVGGHGYRIPADALRQALDHSASVRDLLLRYVQTFLVQTAQTAHANVSAPVEERLARWLLMYHDRQDSDDLPVTHEFLSLMLGVRRPSVTVALHMLEGAYLIKARRGHIKILNRAGLEEVAGEIYGPAEAEYERLIGPLRRRPAN